MSAQGLFISHANEDGEVAERIVAYLEAHGVTCWISSRDIPPSSIYAEAITRGVMDAVACGVIVSQHANESDAIKRELELASHHKKRFIPIRIDATEPGPGLDYYLRNTQWIDFGRDGERALDRIVAHMKGAPAPARPAAPAQSAPPAAAPAPAKKSGAALGLIAAAGAIAAVAAGGWFAWSEMNNANMARDAQAALLQQSASTSAEQTALLAKERDAALAVANTERRQREERERNAAKLLEDSRANEATLQQQLAQARTDTEAAEQEAARRVNASTLETQSEALTEGNGGLARRIGVPGRWARTGVSDCANSTEISIEGDVMIMRGGGSTRRFTIRSVSNPIQSTYANETRTFRALYFAERNALSMFVHVNELSFSMRQGGTENYSRCQ